MNEATIAEGLDRPGVSVPSEKETIARAHGIADSPCITAPKGWNLRAKNLRVALAFQGRISSHDWQTVCCHPGTPDNPGVLYQKAWKKAAFRSRKQYIENSPANLWLLFPSTPLSTYLDSHATAKQLESLVGVSMALTKHHDQKANWGEKL